MTLRTALFFIIVINFILGAVILFNLPHGAYSLDLSNYLEVLRVLDHGGNPYEETSHLNYAPAWLQILWLLAKLVGPDVAARATSIKILNAAAAAVTSCVICIAISKLRPVRQAFWLTLLGFVLNPVIILLVYVHGSFDPLVALAMTSCLLLFNLAAKESNSRTWLAASLALGIGILLKTMPVILLPLLFLRQTWLPRRTFIGGLILALAPFLVGIGVLYFISPDATSSKVLNYASIPGYFGITGLFGIAGFPSSFNSYYTTFFRLLLVFGLSSAVIFYRRTSLKFTNAIYRYAVIATLFLVTLGPGFGTQYLIWLLPLMLMRFGLADGTERISVLFYSAFYLISAATYIFEYSHYSVLSGTLAQHFLSGSTGPMLAVQAAAWRLPLFITMCTLLIIELIKFTKLTLRADGA